MDWKGSMEAWVGQYVKADVHTVQVGVVEAVGEFESKQYVDVSPLVTRLYDDGRKQKRTIIYRVPIIYPAGGGGILSFPTAVGDGVVILVSERDMDSWRQSDGVQETPAKTTRTHHLTDSICIAGLFNPTTTMKPSPTDTEWRFQNSKVTQTPAGEITLTNPSGDLVFKTNGEVLHPSGAKITSDGDFVTDDDISLKNHTHQVIVTSGSSSGTYTSEVAQ